MGMNRFLFFSYKVFPSYHYQGHIHCHLSTSAHVKRVCICRIFMFHIVHDLIQL